jgi:hypothetical protein
LTSLKYRRTINFIAIRRNDPKKILKPAYLSGILEIRNEALTRRDYRTLLKTNDNVRSVTSTGSLPGTRKAVKIILLYKELVT